MDIGEEPSKPYSFPKVPPQEIYRAYYSADLGLFELPSFLGKLGFKVRVSVTNYFQKLNSELIYSFKLKRLCRVIAGFILFSFPALFLLIYSNFQDTLFIMLPILFLLDFGIIFFLWRQIKKLNFRVQSTCQSIQQPHVFASGIGVALRPVINTQRFDYTFIEIKVFPSGESSISNSGDGSPQDDDVFIDSREPEQFKIEYDRKDLLPPKLFEPNSLLLEEHINDIYQDFKRAFIEKPSFFYLRLRHLKYLVSLNTLITTTLIVMAFIRLIHPLISLGGIVLVWGALAVGVRTSDKRFLAKLLSFAACKEEANVYGTKLKAIRTNRFFKPFAVVFVLSPNIQDELLMEP